MQKRALFLGFFSFIFGINLVSASLSDILYFIDPSTMILGTIFIVSFALIHFALSRALRGNTAISAIISLSLSLLLIYGVNRTGLDFEGFFFDLGFSGELLYMIVPLLLLGTIIYLWVKKKLGMALAAIGAFLIGIASFTDLVYEKGVTNTIGAILLFLGIWLWWRGRRGPRTPNPTRRRWPWGRNPPPGTSKPPQQIQQKKINKLNLTRKIGIKNLQKEINKLNTELQEGYVKATNLNRIAQKLGWTKAGVNPKQGESPKQTKERANKASKAYREWHGQFSRNILIQKQIKETQKRIDHLQNQIK